MSDVVDAVVIGAGVVGLAIARELAMRGREVIVLEKNRAIGEETSARNSEVIHAGIYYPTGSLKARLCVEGRQWLYAYCAEKGIPHRRCGKLILAVHDAQRSKLDALERTALANGVTDLESLHARDIAAPEHARRAVGPGAGGALRGGPLVAVDRNRRQPRVDARVSRRPRARGRIDRAARPLRSRRARPRAPAPVLPRGT